MCLLMFSCSPSRAVDIPSHDRPYFFPQNERDRILRLIQTQEWAKEDYARIRQAAEKGKGYEAAFLFALGGDAGYLPAAKAWLLDYGKKGGDILNAKEKLNDPDFFKGGQPWISPVYYNLDISHMIAYDWVYKALSPEEKSSIEDGILTSARFRMKCMDRWSQTPNLVFKPTYMVAMAGLATDNKELLEWGFHRNPGSTRGGYYEVLNTMLVDGGPWAEATIYPIAHKGLELMAKMSFYRNLYDGKDWFPLISPRGGSPKGLMDYYIDTAYPIERTGYGKGQVRVVTYGDGATNPNGDLFLANPAGAGLNMADELAAAYAVSGDLRYAAFLSMVPDYKPNLIDRRPLPEKINWPSAPSKIWQNYGLAMLRSDESPAYWTSGKAIAVFQIMTQGYGHDHRDKFSITLHGAGRLFYPDYNNIQYENPSVGWTRNSIAHNTMLVDESETKNAEPTGVRFESTPDIKFLATSASGVFDGVNQTRALLLTQDYLLDLFHAASNVPHTYDYVLHSFGKIMPVDQKQFSTSRELGKRYSLVQDQQAMNARGGWSVDFLIKDQPAAEKSKYGREWYSHSAALRLTASDDQATLVVHGTGPDMLPMLVARRTGIQDTVFSFTHEPYTGEAQPKITHVTKIARTQDAIVVRIDAKDYTDYAAVAFGPQKNLPNHVIVSDNDTRTVFAFRNYGFIRVVGNERIIARGGWIGFRLPHAQGRLTINGQPAAAKSDNGYLVFGTLSGKADSTLRVDPECPFPVKFFPEAVRMFPRDTRKITYRIRNVLKESVSGWLEFEVPKGLAIDGSKPEFGPLKPGETADVVVTFRSNNPKQGRHILPYRIHYRQAGGGKSIRTAAKSIVVAIDALLESVYQYPQPAVYRVHAPRYTVKLDMFNGLSRYLADDDDTIRLDGNPLFTFSDGNQELLSDKTKTAFTWPVETPALLTASLDERARYQVLFFGDRLMVKMDPNWTQFEKTFFTVPGIWVSPGGPPQWSRIMGGDRQGKDSDAQPGTIMKVSAAELAFPGARWDLCFQFHPPQDVTFAGSGMKFPLNNLKGDSWTIGFCKPGGLETWRWK